MNKFYLEVHPAPVDASLHHLDVLHSQLRWAGAELEVGPGSKLTGFTPPRPKVPGSMPGIIAVDGLPFITPVPED